MLAVKPAWSWVIDQGFQCTCGTTRVHAFHAALQETTLLLHRLLDLGSATSLAQVCGWALRVAARCRGWAKGATVLGPTRSQWHPSCLTNGVHWCHCHYPSCPGAPCRGCKPAVRRRVITEHSPRRSLRQDPRGLGTTSTWVHRVLQGEVGRAQMQMVPPQLAHDQDPHWCHITPQVPTTKAARLCQN